MDKDEERHENKVEKVKQKPLGIVYLPMALEYRDAVAGLLDDIENSRKDGQRLIQKRFKSMFADKTVLGIIAKLVNVSHEISSLAIKTAYTADYLNRKTEILEDILRKLVDKVKDMPAKEDFEELIRVKEQIAHIDAVAVAWEKKANEDKTQEKPNKPKKREDYVI